MDPRESQILSLSICQKLFDIVMKILTAQTCKTVTLGCPPSQRSPESVNLQPSSGSSLDKELHPVNQEEATTEKGSRTEMSTSRDDPTSEESVETAVDDMNNVTVFFFHNKDENGLSGSNAGQEEPIPEDLSQMKGMKKSVSFHDKVETIERKKKKKIKRSKSTESLTSMVLSDDEQQPLKPILKMPSDVNEAENLNS